MTVTVSHLLVGVTRLLYRRLGLDACLLKASVLRFLQCRNVGSDARSVRHSGASWGSELRVGTGVRDDNIENFFHSADIEEDFPSYWRLPAGTVFKRELILAGTVECIGPSRSR